MANAISAITRYFSDLMDKKYAVLSKTAALEPEGNKLRFINAHTVAIPKLTLSGLGNYSKTASDSYPSGDITHEYETFTLANDRAKSFRLDRFDNEETEEDIVKDFMSDMSEFYAQYVIPEVDAIRFAKLVTRAGTAATPADLTAANAITAIEAGRKTLANAHVPMSAGQTILYVSEEMQTLLNLSTEISHYFSVREVTNAAGISNKVTFYQDCPVISVPSDMFRSTITLSATAGYTPGTKLINFMFVNKQAALPVMKHKQLKVITPDVNQANDEYLFKFRCYHDLFVPDNKTAGVYVHVKSTAEA